ncbi:MAG: phosphoribosylformylglycinamidine cyclo-ligase [Syntrophales bacterium]|jgi:phosphoribosylformylglycinamidine cyclo-ligase|nr:phosphoribosylformylglycinamidine cyclo-ligase [Syntrophales bacterium]MCK9527254.1 phosphoribosylformylglycinamidine cyclo-ligase [Syntrophales bacterium]MDX9921276.1 phosphoribosylformylglycinamidine cyclo-ligase [Syntrophales bacterium]
MSKKAVSYRDAGVDIDRANSFVESIKPLVGATTRQGVLGTIGGFGGLFHLDREMYRNPLLVATTDGVGTKLMIAHAMDRHDTVGIDLVAMNVNDLIVQGAEPLFFLDYIATGKLDPHRCRLVVEGISKGCVEAGCALLGGETAEMPQFYREDEYDLAGFCVGVVERESIIDGSGISLGDRIIGLPSSGLHSNGYSLARRVFFQKKKLKHTDIIDGLRGTLGDELLRPTRIYVKTVLSLIKNVSVKGIVHITGGGFYENVPRILHPALKARIEKKQWERPAVFEIMQAMGNIKEAEMYRVFNMGIGMMLIVGEEDADDALDHLTSMGETATVIGSIEHKSDDEAPVLVV